MINFQDGTKKSLIMLAQIGAQGILPKPSDLPPLGKYEAIVHRVIDGDTVVLMMNSGKQLIVRLAYIDAPEIDQPWGIESRDYLNCYHGHYVKVDIVGYDKYHRAIGVICCESDNLNELQLEHGLAWIYRRADFPDNFLLKFGYAVANKLGMWQDANNIDPYLWRRGTRS
jgi:endonuclease YncB( thermonuclease family)